MRWTREHLCLGTPHRTAVQSFRSLQRLTIPPDTDLTALPTPPTEHQQSHCRHGCNWKQWLRWKTQLFGMRLLQGSCRKEGGKKTKQNKKKKEVGWLPKLLITVPGCLGRHGAAQCHMPKASRLQTSSPAMYVACTCRLSSSIRKSAPDRRERKQLSEEQRKSNWGS